jgi:hypothetical protein
MNQSDRITRFVVAGCSRSGTTYMAKLMSALGYPCGHERIFNIWRIFRIEGFSDPMTAFFEQDAKQGDASFLSIPYLDQLPAGTLILHQIRNPLDVIRSHMGMRFFADPYVPNIYLAKEHPQILEFLRSHRPVILEAGSEILRCMRYWYHWNRFAERARENSSVMYIRYRVEEIDMGLLRTVLERMDPGYNEERCRQALNSINKNTNTRRRDTTWTWDNLPSGEDKDQILELSRSYGYDPQ